MLKQLWTCGNINVQYRYCFFGLYFQSAIMHIAVFRHLNIGTVQYMEFTDDQTMQNLYGTLTFDMEAEVKDHEKSSSLNDVKYLYINTVCVVFWKAQQLFACYQSISFQHIWLHAKPRTSVLVNGARKSWGSTYCSYERGKLLLVHEDSDNLRHSV